MKAETRIIIICLKSILCVCNNVQTHIWHEIGYGDDKKSSVLLTFQEMSGRSNKSEPKKINKKTKVLNTMKKAKIILQASVCAAVIGLAGTAAASAITYTVGTDLIVTGASSPVSVTADFVSKSASDTDVLELYAVKNDTFLPVPTLGTAIFNNQVTSAGATATLGNFSPGTELIFALLVYNYSATATDHEGSLINTWYSGSDYTMNDDALIGSGAPHYVHFDPTGTSVTAGVPTTTVGTEDEGYGGDYDYNDLIFSFSGVSTPSAPDVAGTMTLLGLGLGGLTALGRRFRK
jgi:hypothetical protein